MVHATPVRVFIAAVLLSLGALTSPVVLAQSMVSVRGKTVNMRSGPGLESPVLWELHQGYPLKVLRRQGTWLQVQDFENDRGWVSRKLTGNAPHHVVKADKANIRKGPGTQHRKIGVAEYGELLRTREKRGGWVQVERTDGQTGWIAKSLLWGW